MIKLITHLFVILIQPVHCFFRFWNKVGYILINWNSPLRYLFVDYILGCCRKQYIQLFIPGYNLEFCQAKSIIGGHNSDFPSLLLLTLLCFIKWYFIFLMLVWFLVESICHKMLWKSEKIDPCLHYGSEKE